MPELTNLAAVIARFPVAGRVVSTRDYELPLDQMVGKSPFGAERRDLAGRSVVLRVSDMAKAAAALIDLDGVARRILLCPPGYETSKIEHSAQLIEADAVVFDENDDEPTIASGTRILVQWPLRERPEVAANLETEWVLPTSGTSGTPKLAVHTLRTLMNAIAPAPPQQWATFYDIRRYGGLQIFLRALAGSGSLRLSGHGEDVDKFLARCADKRITHISGTPTHWRLVLFSGAASNIDPQYIRLSGEIADDKLLSRLSAAYPRAEIDHAYASTEAGVVFEVGDRRAGFPSAWLGDQGSISLKISDGSLRVRTAGRALRLLGEDAPALVDDEDFVDTGDMIETRGDRCYFMGRRGGILNVGGAKVHPEEVEAALNLHDAVRASRVYGRSNPLMGTIVVAEVLLKDPAAKTETLEAEIMAAARERLGPNLAPAQLRFVAELPVTEAGKLRRN